jgi:hypothetical protein
MKKTIILLAALALSAPACAADGGRELVACFDLAILLQRTEWLGEMPAAKDRNAVMVAFADRFKLDGYAARFESLGQATDEAVEDEMMSVFAGRFGITAAEAENLVEESRAVLAEHLSDSDEIGNRLEKCKPIIENAAERQDTERTSGS